MKLLRYLFLLPVSIVLMVIMMFYVWKNKDKFIDKKGNFTYNSDEVMRIFYDPIERLIPHICIAFWGLLIYVIFF